jgi:RNA polymerase sigma-70 factor (family 1)
MIAAERIAFLQLRLAQFEDQKAYEELYVSFYKYLYNFAWSFVKSKQLAEEIVSDVFIKVWQKRTTLRSIDNFKVYLYVATKNISLNYLGKTRNQSYSDIEDLSAELISNYSDPEQLLITSDMMVLINNAIAQLPSRCRIIFQLVKEDKMKCREVAEVLQISPKTVENQVTIAVRKIGNAVRFDIGRALVSPTGQASK